MAVSDDIAVDLVSERIDLLRVAASTRLRILRLLELLKTDLRRQLLDLDVTGTANVASQRRRIARLLTRVEKTIKSGLREPTIALRGELIDIAKNTRIVLPQVLNAAISLNLIEPAFTAAEMTALVDEATVLGAPLSDWWERQSFNLRQRFAQQVRLGVAAGESNDQIISRIIGGRTGRTISIETSRGLRTVNQYRGGIMQTTAREAEMLVRTSVQSISNEVIANTYAANDDILKGVQLLVTLDARTSKICMARSGGAWDINTGAPLARSAVRGPFPGYPPYHPHCRSVTIPVLKTWSELAEEATGKKLDILESAPSSTRASMDGQVAADLNFERWLRAKGDAFASRKLGPGRFKLWRDGKISLSQLIDQSGRPRTLVELRRLAS